MTQRRGLMVGSGRKGYYNIQGRDPLVHRQSALGIKQPQRMPQYGGKRELTDKEYWVEGRRFIRETENINHLDLINRAEKIGWEIHPVIQNGRVIGYEDCGGNFGTITSWKRQIKEKGGKYPKQLPIITIAGKQYYVDERLNQVRNVQDVGEYMTLDEAALLLHLSKGGKLPFGNQGIDVFELPVQNAIYVPSTDKDQREIPQNQFADRINETEDFLAKLYGGYTKVEHDGGFTDNGKIIRERGARVTAYATKADAKDKNKGKQLKHFLMDKRKNWGQISMGIENKGKLYYISRKERKAK